MRSLFLHLYRRSLRRRGTPCRCEAEVYGLFRRVRAVLVYCFAAYMVGVGCIHAFAMVVTKQKKRGV